MHKFVIVAARGLMERCSATCSVLAMNLKDSKLGIWASCSGLRFPFSKIECDS